MKARISTAIVMGLLFLIAAPGVFSTTHVIQFGGAFGYTYSPSSLTCSVGDTIKWEGDFSMHPLSSTTIPPGASTWHSGSGSTFIYVVTIAGIYHYQCDFHAGIGMIGQFTANPATGIEEQQKPESFELGQNYPNPFNPETVISYSLPEQKAVTVKIYNASGQAIRTLFDGVRPEGRHDIVWDSRDDSGRKSPSGLYICRVKAGTDIRSMKMILMK
jgi:plastocyanin